MVVKGIKSHLGKVRAVQSDIYETLKIYGFVEVDQIVTRKRVLDDKTIDTR